MTKGTFLVILSALLLLQGCCGRPNTDTEPKTAVSSEENGGVNPKAKVLVLSVFEELSAFVDYTIKEGEKLLNEVAADVAATEDKDNEEISRRTKNISDVVDKMEKLKKLSAEESYEEKWDIASDMFDIFEQYNMTTKADPTPEDKTFAMYFEKHGIESFKENGRNKLIEGINDLGEKFENFWNELSTEEREEFPKFRAWQQKFKEETEYEKKLEMIVIFFIRQEEGGEESTD